MKISVIGLGKIGSCMVAAYAHEGHDVIGYDVKESLVRDIAAHRAPFAEHSLQEMLTESADRIRATTDLRAAVFESDISLIIVPTPSKEDGTFVTEFVENACAAIGRVLKEKEGFHIISVVSTVLPGDSEEKIIPAIEQASGKRRGVDFGYAYNPSFIALGDVIRNLLYPDMHLVGATDNRTAKTLTELYAAINENGARVECMSVVSAEITKIALNSYITQKITFANRLADFASRVPGADVDAITTALGADTRIGAKYLRAGLGYGGPCFPRDNKALAASARRWGADQETALTVDAFNQSLNNRVIDHCFKDMPRTARVALLGTSYKPKTGLLDESPSIDLAKKLLASGYQITFFNPPPAEDPSAVLGLPVRNARTLQDALDGADVYVIGYPSTEFDHLVEYLKGITTPKTVIDPWRTYRDLENLSHVTYIPFGIGPTPIQ